MKKIKTSTLLFVMAVVIVSAIFGANTIQQEKLIADKDAPSSISSYDEFVSMHNNWTVNLPKLHLITCARRSTVVLLFSV